MSTRAAGPDVADFVFAVWARRYVLLGLTLLAAVATFAITKAIPRSYRATATLIIAGSKVPAAAGDVVRPDSRVYADTYAELLRSRAIASRVVSELHLDQAPGHLNDSNLASRLDIRALPGTLLLTVSLEMPDADLAARVVNAQTGQAVELTRTLSSNELTDTRRYLELQVAAAKTELDRRQETLRDLKSTLRYEEADAQLKYLLGQRGDLEAARDRADREAGAAEAEVKSFDKTLQGQTKTITLTKSVVDDPAFTSAAQGSTGRDVKSLVGLQMKSEELNPVVTKNEPERALAAANAASNAARRTVLDGQLTGVEGAIRGLERDLADKKARLDSAQRDYDLAKSAFENFSKSYESARLSVAASGAELKIVSPAMPDPRPVGPLTLLNVLIAITTTFTLSVFVLLLIDHLRTARLGQALTHETDVADAPPVLRRSR